MANATSLPLTTGEYIGVGACALATGSSGEVLELNATTRKFQGITKLALANQLADYGDAITLAQAATYDWNTTVRNLGSDYAAGTQDISLPTELQITNWVPGEPPRKLYKLQTSANGFNLLASANCTINGDTADTDMSPVPGSTNNPSATVNSPYYLVYRLSATAYWVLGYAS
jgi:hypothetical protein